MSEHTPRSAALVFTDALGHLDLVQPESLREPVRNMLRAGIEQCAVVRSLLGKPIMHTLDLAEALNDAAERGA